MSMGDVYVHVTLPVLIPPTLFASNLLMSLLLCCIFCFVLENPPNKITTMRD